jgi:hypothetical protein
VRREGGAEAVAPFTMPTAELERYKKGTKLPTIQLVAEHGNNVFTVRPTRATHFRSPKPCSTAAPSLPTPLAPPGRLVRPTFAGRAGHASLYSDGAFVSLSETRRDQSNWYAAPRR